MSRRPKRRWVRRPLVQFDGRKDVRAHGRQRPVRGVWHTTECNDSPGIRELEGVANFWRRQGRGYGAHVVIDKSGNSALCVNPNEIAWAVENHNTGTVSIELIGFARFVPKLWWARVRQLNKLARWMAWLNLEYGIPLTFGVNKGWSGHADQSKAFGGSHWDPGRWFPKKYVLRRAQQYRVNGWT